MAERTVDVRRGVAAVRRNTKALWIAALVGGLAGLAWVGLNPAEYTSTSQVLLPQLLDSTGQSSRDADTERQVASSDLVLGEAGRSMSPPLTSRQTREQVRVRTPTAQVIEFVASASDRDTAEGLASAAADAEVAYVAAEASRAQRAASEGLDAREEDLKRNLRTVTTEISRTKARLADEPSGSAQNRADATALAQLRAQQADLAVRLDDIHIQQQDLITTALPATAQVISPATPAERPNLWLRTAAVVATAGLLGVGLVSSVIAYRGSRDTGLRHRDSIAQAIGASVVASVSAEAPSTVAGWSNLMETYQPEVGDSWAWRQVMRRIPSAHLEQPQSVVVATLAGDRVATAVAPQLAAFAASTGIATRIVVARRPEKDPSLWASVSRDDRHLRPHLFTGATARPALTVTLVVLGPGWPDPEDPLSTDATVLLAVSPGAATALDLARAGIALDDLGMTVTGVIVANPDPVDQSSGRIPAADDAGQPVRLDVAGSRR